MHENNTSKRSRRKFLTELAVGTTAVVGGMAVRKQWADYRKEEALRRKCDEENAAMNDAYMQEVALRRKEIVVAIADYIADHKEDILSLCEEKAGISFAHGMAGRVCAIRKQPAVSKELTAQTNALVAEGDKKKLAAFFDDAIGEGRPIAEIYGILERFSKIVPASATENIFAAAAEAARAKTQPMQGKAAQQQITR